MNLSSVQATPTIFFQDTYILYPKYGVGINNVALQLYKNAKTINEQLAQYIEKGLTFIDKEYLVGGAYKTPEDKFYWIFEMLTNIGQYLDQKKPLQWEFSGISLVLEPSKLSSEQRQKYVEALVAIPIKTNEVAAKLEMANSSGKA